MPLGIENKTVSLSVSSNFEFIITPTSHLNQFFPVFPASLNESTVTLLSTSELLVLTLTSLLLAFTSNKSPNQFYLFIFLNSVNAFLLIFTLNTLPQGLHHFTSRLLQQSPSWSASSLLPQTILTLMLSLTAFQRALLFLESS